MSTESLERRIREYEAFGIHRTGWPGDTDSAGWVRKELQVAGIDASLEEFEFPMLHVRTAMLSWGGDAVEGVPLYDCGLTEPGGVLGALALAGADDVRGKIVVAGENDPSFNQVNIYDRVAGLEQAGAAGLVLPRCDSLGAINVLNAYRIGEPFGLPVLQVTCPDVTELSDAAEYGTRALLTIDAHREPGAALNVVVTLPGEGGDAPPLAVMTPRSGWFTCASERGGGIAIWLGLAESLHAMQNRRRTVHMVASSGHELNHYGLQAFLASRKGLETEAIAWLHLGALIGSRATPVRIEPSDDELGALAESAFRSSGTKRWVMWNQKGGEAANIAAAGGRYLSLRGGPSDTGADTFFHSPNDTFDRASDIELVAAAGRACVAIAGELISA